ncbi:MAG: hypothetical protein M1819_006169 [Sarea resinae]|nr:MAG: hypothetical protein M1819_006169 [Sarea resinae]
MAGKNLTFFDRFTRYLPTLSSRNKRLREAEAGSERTLADRDEEALKPKLNLPNKDPIQQPLELSKETISSLGRVHQSDATSDINDHPVGNFSNNPSTNGMVDQTPQKGAQSDLGAEAPHKQVGKEPPSRKIRCTACTISYEKCKVGELIYPCRVCNSPYCNQCVKSMFMIACKDESRMPPRCCQIMQLSSALPFLTKEQAALYRTKYEEWSTPNRVYCPVPTCSAFISNRLLPAHSPPITSTDTDSTVDTSSSTSTTKAPASQSFSCPQCLTSLCGNCHQVAHPQSTRCPRSDVPLGLSRLLEHWKYKRCPKCRTAVKLMWGCSHIHCRCGAQWCYSCSLPIDECETEGCGRDDDDSDDLIIDVPVTGYAGDEAIAQEGNEQEVVDGEAIEQEGNEDETVDGIRPVENGSQASPLTSAQPQIQEEALDIFTTDGTPDLDLGPEPSRDALDTWSCKHDFSRTRVSDFFDGYPGSVSSSYYNNRELECHRCWSRAVAAADLAVAWKQTTSQSPSRLNDSRSMTQLPKAANASSSAEKQSLGDGNLKADLDVNRSTAWMCTCGVVLCADCKTQYDLGLKD